MLETAAGSQVAVRLQHLPPRLVSQPTGCEPAVHPWPSCRRGYSIGQRLIDEFLAKSKTQRCVVAGLAGWLHVAAGTAAVLACLHSIGLVFLLANHCHMPQPLCRSASIILSLAGVPTSGTQQRRSQKWASECSSTSRRQSPAGTRRAPSARWWAIRGWARRGATSFWWALELHNGTADAGWQLCI